MTGKLTDRHMAVLFLRAAHGACLRAAGVMVDAMGDLAGDDPSLSAAGMQVDAAWDRLTGAVMRELARTREAIERAREAADAETRP